MSIGRAVMALDRHCPAGELENFVVVQNERLPFSTRGVDVFRPSAAVLGVNHFALLFAERLLDDRTIARVIERGLEDKVLVRNDRALHDVFAEAPGGIDHHHAAESPFRCRS